MGDREPSSPVKMLATLLVPLAAFGVDLRPLHLRTEVQPMSGGELVFHPQVFAELQDLSL